VRNNKAHKEGKGGDKKWPMSYLEVCTGPKQHFLAPTPNLKREGKFRKGKRGKNPRRKDGPVPIVLGLRSLTSLSLGGLLKPYGKGREIVLDPKS